MFNQSDNRKKAEILAPFVSDNGPITTEEEALEGARHIISQQISDNSEFRQYVREHAHKKGVLTSKITTSYKSQKTKYDMYDNFSEPLTKLASHRLLAIRRGEKEKVLTWKIGLNDDFISHYLQSKIIKNKSFIFIQELYTAIETAYKKSIYPSIQTDCFNELCKDAETQSIEVFSKNLHNLLLSAPAGNKTILGIDPGFPTGCKLAVIDPTGQYQCHNTIFPVPPNQKIKEATQITLDLLSRYPIELIAIGNGTGSKETFQFIKTLIKEHHLNVIPVIVNEAGASVYSASEIAIQEYPQLDITIRGAISIAHRLQDPLSELVKIDPKAIGVGQYQHDVNQTQLKEALTFTTELAVNTVGVDLNTASPSILAYVSGIGPSIAQNIVDYRQEYGPFTDRQTLLNVPKLGKKRFNNVRASFESKIANTL